VCGAGTPGASLSSALGDAVAAPKMLLLEVDGPDVTLPL